MFGFSENTNSIEDTIPTEAELALLLLTSDSLAESTAYTEKYIRQCELNHIWKDYTC